jgi:hypothetical protein
MEDYATYQTPTSNKHSPSRVMSCACRSVYEHNTLIPRHHKLHRYKYSQGTYEGHILGPSYCSSLPLSYPFRHGRCSSKCSDRSRFLTYQGFKYSKQRCLMRHSGCASLKRKKNIICHHIPTRNFTH